MKLLHSSTKALLTRKRWLSEAWEQLGRFRSRKTLSRADFWDTANILFTYLACCSSWSRDCKFSRKLMLMKVSQNFTHQWKTQEILVSYSPTCTWQYNHIQSIHNLRMTCTASADTPQGMGGISTGDGGYIGKVRNAIIGSCERQSPGLLYTIHRELGHLLRAIWTSS